MSNLVRSTQKAIVHSKSTSGVVGKGLFVVGAGGLGLWFAAGLLPFVTLPMLLVAAVIAGIFIME